MIWLGLAIALIWAILKTFGYIHSPPWQEALPVYGIGVALAGGIFKFGHAVGDIQRTVHITNESVGALTQQTHALDQRLTRLEMRMDHVESGLNEFRGEFKGHMVSYHTG